MTMRNYVILGICIIGVVFGSCKKKSKDETPAPPSLTYVLTKDSSYSNNNNQYVKKFDYNSSKKLVKVSYKYGSSTSYTDYDTIYYNSSGKVSKVESYYAGNSVPVSVNTYNYTSDVLTSVHETGVNNNGAYDRTRTFTYSGGKLATQTVAYTTGSSGDGGPENIASVVYTGNNITSADLTGMGLVTLTWETTAKNPYYGLNYQSDDLLSMFCQDNALKVYMTSDPTQVFMDRSYTYADGRVATITEVQSNGGSQVTWTNVMSYTGI